MTAALAFTPTPNVVPERFPGSIVQEARAEFYDRALDQMSDNLDLLRSLGLNSQALPTYLGALAVVKVTFDAIEGWDFSDHGEPAIVAEVFGRDGETPIDLVAWPVDAPDQFETFAGYGEGFGIEQVNVASSYFGGRPLVVHRTPLKWLRAGGLGVVILNQRNAPEWLGEARGCLATESIGHGHQLARLLLGYFPPSRILAPRGADPK